MLRLLFWEAAGDGLQYTSIAEYNQACVMGTSKPAVPEMSRNIDVKFDRPVNSVSKENVKILKLPTKQIVADMFRKNLVRVK